MGKGKWEKEKNPRIGTRDVPDMWMAGYLVSGFQINRISGSCLLVQRGSIPEMLRS